jgi:hypothetical protein
MLLIYRISLFKENNYVIELHKYSVYLMHNTFICSFVFSDRNNKLTMVWAQKCEQKIKLDKFFTLIQTCGSVHMHGVTFSSYM